MIENIIQDVAHTLCTIPAAITAPSIHRITSGKSFVWKFFPNIVDSKLPSPVRENTKNREPKSPPSMVLSCEDDSHCLYICIPENMITVKMSEMRKEFPFDNAIFELINLQQTECN